MISREIEDRFILSSCLIQGSLHINSRILVVIDANICEISNVSFQNNQFFNSCAIAASEIYQINLNNVHFSQNEWENSFMMNLNFQICYLQNIFLARNYLSESYVAFCEITDRASYLSFQNLLFENNFFESQLIAIAPKTFLNILNFTNFIFWNNIFLENVFDFLHESIDDLIKINLHNLSIFSNNLKFDSFRDLTERQQYFFKLGGNLNISILNSIIDGNSCFGGPCGFVFFSMKSTFYVNFVSSSFKNNLVFYSNNFSIGLIFLNGPMNILLMDINISNNSISYNDKKIDDYKKEIKFTGFIYSSPSSQILLIFTNCFFNNNFGISDDASCILFHGISLDVRNSSFIKNNFLRSNFFEIDCGNINFENLIFESNKGGILYLRTKKESIFLFAKNITIQSNVAQTFAFRFNMQKFEIIFDKIMFFENICYSSGTFASFYSLGRVVNEQIVVLSNSFFRNNTSINTKIQTGFFELYLIGSLGMIINCMFVNNLAQGIQSYGAVFYLRNEVTSKTEFLNCYFSNNSAEYGGVAFHKIGGLYFENCFFESNSARNSKGFY